jgi:hypothetical protein
MVNSSLIANKNLVSGNYRYVLRPHDGGDHAIFIRRVEAVGFGAEGKQPLVYFANRYAGVRD